MGGQKRVDGETVALKKRKRDKIDDERRSSKKHRSKSRGQVEASASTDAAPEKNGGICEGSEKAMIEKEAKMDALSYAEKSKKPDQQAALWTLSKPMGGRMLNIDPIFSVDERHVIIAKVSRSTFKSQMLHWHRTCVHSVKWSRDGNYLVSGGEESTLVLWQMDTGPKYTSNGSVLFAAFGGPAEAVLYVINTATGEVFNRLHGLFKGAVRAIEALASCLIMLSEELIVYDIVSDELRYGFSLNESLWPGFPMTQLAVNHQSQTFALAVPLPAANCKKLGPKTKTEVTVFTVEDSQPQLVQVLPTLVISVLPETASTGFVVFDVAAQIWSVTEGAEAPPLMQPLADIQLDKQSGEPANGPLQGSAEEDAAASDEDMADGDEETVDDEDDEIHAAVVAPQRLADIFEAAPAFVMPPIEDLFYQVSNLFSAKPLKPGVST
ncbi:hypothetical protein P8C59_002850 [Phyllachora maydis]|uniref:Uncharacterized protein n=1 Tax=Phyllachora maydis TaxID=1825666 RepID=A0AAD9MBU5_9PEZI|nr:hypothetical protein P8C59_002850 [Phyllachora maydis]